MRKRSEKSPVEEPEAASPPGDPEPSEDSPGKDVVRESEDVDDPTFAGLPKYRPAPSSFDRVVEKVFVREEDFERAYDDLTKLLRSVEGKTENGFFRDALTRAADGKYTASRLLATAKRTLAVWKKDNELVTAAMRERAYRELQEEKKQGERNKTISDADVVSRASLLYPQEFGTYARRQGEYEAAVSAFESLVFAFSDLNANLRSLVESS